MTTKQATNSEIRKLFDRDIQSVEQVKINRDGAVTFRADSSWLDGRFADEYFIVDGRLVHI